MCLLNFLVSFGWEIQWVFVSNQSNFNGSFLLRAFLIERDCVDSDLLQFIERLREKLSIFAINRDIFLTNYIIGFYITLKYFTLIWTDLNVGNLNEFIKLLKNPYNSNYEILLTNQINSNLVKKWLPRHVGIQTLFIFNKVSPRTPR